MFGDLIELRDNGKGVAVLYFREMPLVSMGIAAPDVGITDGSNAIAGQIGELISANVVAASTGLTNVTPLNITSVVLTPGDWDVEASYVITGDGSTTSFTYARAGLSTNSATLPATNLQNVRSSGAFVPPTAEYVSADVAKQRFNVTVNTTVYLVTTVAFTISTAGAGGMIQARRVR